MVATETHKTHAISWVDLATTDLGAALGFYSEALGVDTFNDGETDYYMLMVGHRPAAGAMEMGPDMAGMPPVWSVYVNVQDAAATLAKAAELGGQVVQDAFDIPGGGKIGVLVDPAGAAICIFEGGSAMGFKVMDEPGAPCWFDCRSTNADAADQFYQQLFGWASTPMDGFPYRIMELDGQPICGILAMGEDMADVPSHWAATFSVEDADRVAEFTQAQGGVIVQPPQDTDFGRSAGLVDPWGAGFNVIDRSTAAPGN